MIPYKTDWQNDLRSSIFLQGTVIVIANHGERIDIPSGSILENKIVSGNLRILQHWGESYRINQFPRMLGLD